MKPGPIPISEATMRLLEQKLANPEWPAGVDYAVGSSHEIYRKAWREAATLMLLTGHRYVVSSLSFTVTPIDRDGYYDCRIPS